MVIHFRNLLLRGFQSSRDTKIWRKILSMN